MCRLLRKRAAPKLDLDWFNFKNPAKKKAAKKATPKKWYTWVMSAEAPRSGAATSSHGTCPPCRGSPVEPRRVRRAGRGSMGARVGASLTRNRPGRSPARRLGHRTRAGSEGNRAAACGSSFTLKPALNSRRQVCGTKSSARASAVISVSPVPRRQRHPGTCTQSGDASFPIRRGLRGPPKPGPRSGDRPW